MNAEMKAKLEKYMNEDGYYMTDKILVDFDNYSDDEAFFADTFGDELEGYENQDFSPEYRAALEANEQKAAADNTAKAQLVEELNRIFNKPAAEITDEEWQKLADNYMAKRDSLNGKYRKHGMVHPISETQDGA